LRRYDTFPRQQLLGTVEHKEYQNTAEGFQVAQQYPMPLKEVAISALTHQYTITREKKKESHG
jgi:hypothetical protein